MHASRYSFFVIYFVWYVLAQVTKQSGTSGDDRDGDILSVWSFQVSPWQVERLHKVVGHFMLAHCLLAPYRVIVVRMELYRRTAGGDRIWRFKVNADGFFDFATIFCLLDSLALSWEDVGTLHLSRHSFRVVGWNLCVFDDSAIRATSVVWTRFRVGESATSRAHQDELTTLATVLQRLKGYIGHKGEQFLVSAWPDMWVGSRTDSKAMITELDWPTSGAPGPIIEFTHMVYEHVSI